MGLENYFKALRLRKEALDLRDEVIDLLTKNEEREMNKDDQFRSLLGRYNREVGVLKQKVKDLEDIVKGLDDNTPEQIYIDDNADRDLSEEEKNRLRSLATRFCDRRDEERI